MNWWHPAKDLMKPVESLCPCIEIISGKAKAVNIWPAFQPSMRVSTAVMPSAERFRLTPRFSSLVDSERIKRKSAQSNSLNYQ